MLPICLPLLCLVFLIVLLPFFFMLLPPPTSTLFPYTTLFRSSMQLLKPLNYNFPLFPKRGYHWHYRPIVEQSLQHSILEDRKSTRLNSSHVAISYAVFCLKKKRNAYRFWYIMVRPHAKT